ncbi:MAG: DNA mismatch repair endonuclease MutL [bacterium]|nr:DNA mismatch repair endonuclease MutL [bacterium]
MKATAPQITQLPVGVINKIAAGEVIERPASVVKELLENSVDAGADRIEVAIEKGGADLIRVADNGCGIESEQLALAIAPHATSKILDADDLFSVSTMGFRGEALASISEVSQFTLRSRTADSHAGAEITVDGGKLSGPHPCGCPVGTSIEVRNLFFNTPVRRKFLRTQQTEMGHITEAFLRVALAHPERHFKLLHNGRAIHDLAATENWRDRILALFGREISESLIPIESFDGDVRLWGFVADPSQNRGNNKLQYLFLNRRCIRDRALGHALGEAYRGLLMTGRYPVTFLQFEMPPAVVDVNVHPCKLEVRFQDGGRIYSHLLGALRTKFLATDLTNRVRSAGEEETPTLDQTASYNRSDDSLNRRKDFDDWVQQQLPASPDHAAEQHNHEPAAEPGMLNLTTFDRAAFDLGGGSQSQPAEVAGSTGQPANFASSAPSTVGGGQRVAALQVQNTYLITEDETGLLIIDQHALHERILYERLKTRLEEGEVEIQRLLTPEAVHLAPAEASAVIEATELLADIGLLVEAFGGDTVLVSACPVMLGRMQPAELIRRIAETLIEADGKLAPREATDELLHMMACKAAVKAGDRLTPEEITSLLEQRHLCHDAHHCPHGRPTALVFSRHELDRRFGRLG